MHATPISNSEIALARERYPDDDFTPCRVVLGAPGGDLTGEDGIGPLEVIIYCDEDSNWVHASKWVLNEEERAAILHGDPIWLNMLVPPGHHPPVALNIGDGKF